MYEVSIRSDLLALGQAIWDMECLEAKSGDVSIPLRSLPGTVVLGAALQSGASPSWCAAVRGGQLLILLTGASTATHGAALFSGALLPRARVGNASANGTLATLGVTLAGLAASANAPPYTDCLIAGHSYGGAIAEVAASYMHQSRPGLRVQVFTCGSPRPGDDTLAASMEDLNCVRLMISGDPVPRFPFHPDEAPLGVFTLGWPAALYFSEYSQTPGGALLNPDGTTTPAQLPPLPYAVQTINMLAWLNDIWLSKSNEHSMPSYLARLSKPQVAQLGPPVGTATGFKGEAIFPLPQDAWQAGPVQGLALFLEASSMAGESVYIPPEFRFHYQRIQKLYFVYWMGQQIAEGQSPSKCKTIAKYGNKFLRIQQNAIAFDITAFNQAASAYWTQASSPTSGITPVIQVNY